ncbi:MAG TPA: response regulator [Candidatus Manganitrophaceae bacterium]|nr:response regulator [Candidatus Manganitrophaceae bacterium]
MKTKERDQILVVDDQESFRMFLSDLLLANGWEVWEAGSAEEVLPELTHKKPVAALVDLVLPGMNGLDLLERMKQAWPKTEIILMTSYASLETAIEAIDKGAYGYLRKPFEGPEEVLKLLQRALEKRRLLEENEQLQRDLEAKNIELTLAVQRLTALINAGRAMSVIYELKGLLEFFIEVVVKELQVDRASVMLIDDQKEMRILASRGIQEEVARDVHVPLGEGIAGQVAEKGRPIVVRDVHGNPELPLQGHSGYQSKSFISAPIVLSVPIKLQEKVLGVINVTNKRSGLSFSENDVAFVCSLAGQAAVAIEGARNYEALKKAYEELKSNKKSS